MNEKQARGSGYNIAVMVEDTDASYDLVRRLLSEVAPPVYVNRAKNVEALDLLLEKLKSHGTTPSVFIVDVSINEDTDGIVLIDRLHTNYPEVPIIAYSKFPQYENETLASGAGWFVHKFTEKAPSRLAEIVQKIVREDS
ncbi:MAG: response regulator [bacterium]